MMFIAGLGTGILISFAIVFGILYFSGFGR